ncbi:uncharacterized protein [Lepeophtheirus salmonis]|uniref:uncharacterized protein n=1 Tax=Lepeophtheirus salmonis TaxID=72036 RepID=UPI001AE2DA57|nr:gametocyte-specific factor 1 homolog [Lepeophtheirus salmonis]XP_040574310.1 gametocyte-specific factor 1 homolog [Lepeophtheirus salmonis]
MPKQVGKKNSIEMGDSWMDEATNLVKCPYQPSHKILPERFALHLIRCRKSILADKTSPFYKAALDVNICQFDTTHHIRGGIEKLHEHIKECPTALALQKPVKKVEVPEWKKVRTSVNIQKTNVEEDWDTEENIGTYNPVNKLLANPNMILNPQGLTKSERKIFRQNQREYCSLNSKEKDKAGFDQMWVPPIAEDK